MVVRQSRDDLLKHAITEAAKSERVYRSQREWNEHKRGAAEGLEFWTDRIAYLESLASGWDRPDLES
jgi:hypothetical protein